TEALGRAGQSPRPAAVALHSDDLTLPLHQRGQMCRLATGSRTQIEHALARLRGERACHQHRGTRLRHERTFRPQARAVYVVGLLEHERLGELWIETSA